MVEHSAEELEKENQQLRQDIAELSARLKDKKSPYPTRQTTDISSFFEGRELTIGVLSDNHYGSIHARPDLVDKIYDIFQRNGISKVLNCGDITAGVGVYSGQVHELTHFTYEAQKNYVIQKYPQKEGIKTYLIAGNHDTSFLKGANGGDIVKAICQEREDIVNLGQIEADLKLANNVRVRMRHPSGGPAYALSYKLQRGVSALEGGAKPQIMLEGHYHSAVFLNVRNVDALLVPCTEEQSLYLKAKNLEPVMGAWILDMRLDKKGSLIRFRPELLKFYKRRYWQDERAS